MRPSAGTTPPPTCSTPPCAPCWATTCASRVAGGAGPVALRLLASWATDARGARRRVRPGQRRRAHRRPGARRPRPRCRRPSAWGRCAFFGDKYGETVRVIQAGGTSLEFCGGTHVDSLGQIGPDLVGVRGEHRIEQAADLRRHRAGRARPGHRPGASRPIGRRPAAHRARRPAAPRSSAAGAPARDARRSLPKLRQQSSESVAAELARRRRGRRRGGAAGRRGARCPPGVGPGRAAPRRRACGGPGRVARRRQGGTRGRDRRGAERHRGGARPGDIVGGGGGGSPELAVAGGKDVSRVDEALAEARRLLSA